MLKRNCSYSHVDGLYSAASQSISGPEWSSDATASNLVIFYFLNIINTVLLSNTVFTDFTRPVTQGT